MQPLEIARWSDVADREPVGALVSNVDLVIIRFDDNHSVLYGRCLHRGAHMADGHIDGDNLICGLHGWDYRVLDSGVSELRQFRSRLNKFSSWIEDGDSLHGRRGRDRWPGMTGTSRSPSTGTPTSIWRLYARIIHGDARAEPHVKPDPGIRLRQRGPGKHSGIMVWSKLDGRDA